MHTEYEAGITDDEIDRAVKKVTKHNAGFFEPSWTPMPKRFSGHRHPLSSRFHELLAQAGEMHDAKQKDYGRKDDPFANVRASEEWGMPGWVGCMVRATDKIKRLQKLAQDGELANESALDSFMDLAVYALIGYVLYEEEQG